MIEVDIKYINNWDTILLTKDQYNELLSATKFNKPWFVFDNHLSKATQAVNLNNVLHWRVGAEKD